MIRLSLGRWSERRAAGRIARRLYWGGYVWTPFVRVTVDDFVGI